MQSTLKRNAFFAIIGFSLLILAMMVLLAYFAGEKHLPYWLINGLIVVFLLFIDYQAFKMWQYKETPKKDDVELEIKDTTNE
jgi:steroid 5-alpha reductase family enzyme